MLLCDNLSFEQLQQKNIKQQKELKQKDEVIDIYKDTIEKISAELQRNHLGSVKDLENKIKTILADSESKLVSSQ